jgi:hypothetical protein
MSVLLLTTALRTAEIDRSTRKFSCLKSRANSRVNVELKANISEIPSISVHIDPDDGGGGNLRNIGF